MAFKDNILEFSDNKIVDQDTMTEVMMDWEAPIMQKSAEYICESKGDILEIGFGMGICSDYIQERDVNSHTIVEIHPQVLEKLNEWVKDKDNVTVIEGDWLTSNITGKYDGIFLDTFGDDSRNSFKSFAIKVGKTGSKLTYWNNYNYAKHEFEFDNTVFDVISVTPDDNIYTDISEHYYMPKVIL